MELKNKIKGQVDSEKMSITQEQFFSGPMPPPEFLRQYEEVHEGLANRITSMAESQSNHRHRMEGRMLSFEIIQAILGKILAFFVVIFGLGLGAYLVVKGFEVAGFFAGAIPLAGVIWGNKIINKQQ